MLSVFPWFSCLIINSSPLPIQVIVLNHISNFKNNLYFCRFIQVENMRRLFTLLAVLWSLVGFSQTDTATIMYYNVLNYPGSTGSRVQYFRQINQYVKPDLILITELISGNGAQTLLQEGLNVFGETKYEKAAFIDGPDTDNMLFYNSDKFTLYSQDTIGTLPRRMSEYVLYYNLQQPEQKILFFFISMLPI